MHPKIAKDQPKDFSFTDENIKAVAGIVARYPKGRQQSAVMPLLDLAQRQHGWIPVAAMDEIARILSMPKIKVYEVATFYTMYNLAPVGKNLLQICTTTPCWLRGSDAVVGACRKTLGIDFGETTPDGKFTMVEVECLGACVNAPVVQVNDDYYEDLDADSMLRLLEELSAGRTPQPGSQAGRHASCSAAGATTLEGHVPEGRGAVARTGSRPANDTAAADGGGKPKGGKKKT